MSTQTPSSVRRNADRQKLRERILAEARKIFASDGYDSVSMRKIADRIHYSATAIYLHFKSKEELVRAIADEDYAKLAGFLGQKSKHGKPVMRLRQLANAYIDFGVSHPDSYRLMFMTLFAANSEQDSRLEQGNIDHDAYGLLVQLVQEALSVVAKPPLKDAHLVAQLFWATIHGVVSQRIALGEEAWFQWRPLSKAKQAAIEMLIGSLFSEVK